MHLLIPLCLPEDADAGHWERQGQPFLRAVPTRLPPREVKASHLARRQWQHAEGAGLCGRETQFFLSDRHCSAIGAARPPLKRPAAVLHSPAPLPAGVRRLAGLDSAPEQTGGLKSKSPIWQLQAGSRWLPCCVSCSQFLSVLGLFPYLGRAVSNAPCGQGPCCPSVWG